MKKVCIVTGTRAEYGLLKPLIRRISEDVDLELQLIVTGMHLSPEFGLTYKEIIKDNKIKLIICIILSLSIFSIYIPINTGGYFTIIMWFVQIKIGRAHV